MNFGLPTSFSLSPPVNLPGPTAEANAEYWKANQSFIGGNDNLTDNQQYAQGHANGTATLAYPLRFPPDGDEAKDDVGKCELMFMKCNSSAFSRELVHRYQPRTLSRMNLWLKSKEMRKEWGSRYSVRDFFKEWSLVGVANTDLTDFGGRDQVNRKYANALAVHKLGRVAIPDIWLACNQKAVNGDVLYLLVLKCKYEEAFGSSSTEIELVREQSQPNKTENHCWQILPWIGSMGNAPSPLLYTNQYWAGECFRLGTVTGRIFNPPNIVASNQSLAVDSLSPCTKGSDYRSLINSLPIVEVQFGL
jgi:hypothetical protein